MLPRYVEEDFDDEELTRIFEEAEKRKIIEHQKKEAKRDEHERVFRNYFRLNNAFNNSKKEYDDATAIMLLVSEGKMTSKLSMTEIKKNLQDKYFIMKNAASEMQKCKELLSTF